MSRAKPRPWTHQHIFIKAHEGTGLGSSLSEQLAELNGGTPVPERIRPRSSGRAGGYREIPCQHLVVVHYLATFGPWRDRTPADQTYQALCQHAGGVSRAPFRSSAISGRHNALGADDGGCWEKLNRAKKLFSVRFIPKSRPFSARAFMSGFDPKRISLSGSHPPSKTHKKRRFGLSLNRSVIKRASLS